MEGRCIFSTICNHYQADGHTCNNVREALDYCGTFRNIQQLFVKEILTCTNTVIKI